MITHLTRQVATNVPHLEPMDAYAGQMSPTDPTLPGAGHCALKALANETTPALSAPTLWPRLPSPRSLHGLVLPTPLKHVCSGCLCVAGSSQGAAEQVLTGLSLHVSWVRARVTWVCSVCCLCSDARGEDSPAHERRQDRPVAPCGLAILSLPPAALRASRAHRGQAACLPPDGELTRAMATSPR